MKRIVDANEYAINHGLTPLEISSPHYGLAKQYADLWNMGVTIIGDENQKDRDWYKKRLSVEKMTAGRKNDCR